MSVAAYLAAAEPLFTFEARLPPAELRRLSMRQIRKHLLWWEENRYPLDFHRTDGR